ncbi:MAG: hypothetical protein R3B70_48295 [Polyangiaceae bacterium]
MRRRLLLRLGLTALVAGFAATSCLSPTIPLPPPDVEMITESTEPGIWQISGICKPGALVVVLNDETGTGVVFEDRGETGQWFVQLPAEECDTAWVTQAFGNEESARTTFVVEPVDPNQPESSNCQ